MTAERWRIDAVLVGRPRPLRGDEASAIAKSRQAGPVAVTRLGLAGDEQADRVHHGGPDIAVHLYPFDHYAALKAKIASPLLDAPGALGENLSALGLVESEAAIGDRYRLGSALVEISQGRKPCWKPAHRLRHPALVADLVASGATGWYFRVDEEGSVAEGDMMTLVERPHPEWTVARVFGLIVRGDDDAAALKQLASLDALSADWRGRAARKLAA